MATPPRDSMRCVAAIRNAAQRPLTDDEITQILERIHRTALDIKAGRVQAPPTNLGSPQGLIQHAATLEAQRLVAEADLKARRAVEDAKVAATLQAQVGAMKAGGVSDVEAVQRLLVNEADGRTDNFSLQTRYLGVSQYLKTKIQDTWTALGPRIWEYFQRGEKARLLIQELKGVDTGDAMARKGAEAWRKMTDEAREWFNSKGGNIGHLEDWGLPQHHSQDLVSRAGGAQDAATNRQAWVDFILPLLDRSKYTDLAGRQMTEPEVREFLARSWDTIATGGANKIDPGKPKGNGARANRHAEERQIHFKDADSLLEYWAKFGDRTLPDILMGHLDSMAKDIAFVEHFGSNPNAMFRLLRDTAEVSAKESAPHQSGKADKALARLDRLYDYAAGRSLPVADQRIARGFDIVKNLNVAGKLGSAFWASLIGDKPMFEALRMVNNIPAFQAWWNELRLLNPASAPERRALRRNALMLDYMTQAMGRFGDDLGKSSFGGKVANGVMRVSGMAAVNEWRRGAWALSAMDTLGHLVSTKDFGQIGKQDMRLVQSYGITEHEWKVWKLAGLDDLGHGNNTALTPEAIMRIPDADLKAASLIAQADTGAEAAQVRRDAAIKLIGALTAESHNAVIEPGWKERAMMYGGLQRGNVRDELTRSFWQFKAFPFTQFEKMWQIATSRPTTGGRIGYATMLPVMMTMAGAMMIQVQELLAGRDPRPMADWKFWGAAFMKGGTLGLYGDFLFSGAGTTRYGSGPLEAVAGPTIGAAATLAAFAAKAPGQIAEGKEPQLAAQSINILKGFVPAQNLWYTKAATDHLIFQQAQEAVNPGYLAGARARTLKEFGNDSWWVPGHPWPDRAPDLGHALESRP